MPNEQINRQTVNSSGSFANMIMETVERIGTYLTTFIVFAVVMAIGDKVLDGVNWIRNIGEATGQV